jgi:hypothetical protein
MYQGSRSAAAKPFVSRHNRQEPGKRRWAGGGGEPPGWGPGVRPELVEGTGGFVASPAERRASPACLCRHGRQGPALSKSCPRRGSLSAAAGEVKGDCTNGGGGFVASSAERSAPMLGVSGHTIALLALWRDGGFVASSAERAGGYAGSGQGSGSTAHHLAVPLVRGSLHLGGLGT